MARATAGFRKELLRAKKSKTLVRITNTLDGGWDHGYVIDVGRVFFLLATISHDIRYTGFSASRIADLEYVAAPPRNAKFVEKALRLRGESPPENPRVDLADLRTLLVSAQKAFPLIMIGREEIEPGIAQIGKVVRVSKTHLVLREINTRARWKRKPSKYALKEITSVDFGGFYEHALHLVGGEPPN